MINHVYRKTIVFGFVVILIAASFVVAENGSSIGLPQTKSFREIKEVVIDKKDKDKPLPFGGENWWNTAWSYRKLITIDHIKISGILNKFPLLINLSVSNFDFTRVQNQGQDIRFVNYSDNNTLFTYEIDRWSASSQKAQVWVNVTVISNTVDTKLWIYYGNPGASAGQNPHGVWDANFRMVHHFSEVSGTHYDSTRNHNNGSLIYQAVQNVTGIIGSADYFDGSNDYVRIPSSTSLNLSSVFTLEGWIKASLAQSASGKQPFDKPDCYVYSYDHNNILYRGVVAIQTSTSAWKDGGGTVTVSQGAWHYISGVYDGSNLITYVDGVQKASKNIGSWTLKILPYGFYIGSGFTSPNPASFFNGTIDEVRVSAMARSNSWVNATYRSARDILCSYGLEEALLVNHAPTITTPIPANNSLEIPLSTSQLTFALSDAEGNPVDYTVETSPYIGGKSESAVGNGTKTVSISGLTNSTTYHWFVNATDPLGSGKWTKQWFSFSTPAAWWDGNWLNRKAIIINHSMVSQNLRNFPVLIKQTDTDLKNEAQPNGNDIVFTDGNGIKLNHEIEKYSSTTGELIAWVNVTALSSTHDIVLYMYYGNPECGSQQNPAGVWDLNYRLVHHFKETSGTTHADSTTYRNNGTCYNGVTLNVPGIIGSADSFDGSNDYVGIPNAASLALNRVTVEVWCKTTISTAVEPVICKDYDGSSVLFRIDISTTDAGNGFGFYNSSWHTTAIAGTERNGNWHHLVGSYDGTALKYYFDGVLIDTIPYVASLPSNTALVYFARYQTYYFQGSIDESRVSNYARNASWILTEFRNQQNPATFYSIGSEVSFGNQKPILSVESPQNGSSNILLGLNTLQVNAVDRQGDQMNLIFLTNASGSWTTIGTNNSVYNGTYRQTYTFPAYNTKYWWSIHATDPSGSKNWTNRTYWFTTMLPPGMHKFTVDYSSHLDYGLAYPVTYIFTIPTGLSNLKAYKLSPGEGWVQLPEKTKTDLFSGVEVVRFNYTEHKAYASVAFPTDSDDVYIKITNTSDQTLNVIYNKIAPYYDNRSTAVVITSDDWLTCPGCALPDPYSTNVEFKKVCDACQARNIWYTPGINSNGTIETGWYPNPDWGPNWTIVQQEVSEGYVELAGHSRNHPSPPYTGPGADGYDGEIGGCKQDILNNVSMNPLNLRGSQEYIYTWIQPYGQSDATVRQKLGQYKYICDRSTVGGATSFTSWDATNGLYNPAGYTVLWDGSSTSSLNSAFDSVHNAGGIYLIYGHPFHLDFRPSGHVYQHLNYIANRSDVWYAGMGHLYLYHYMDERNVITHSVNYGNLTPTISSESPIDSSTNVNVGIVTLQITAADPEYDQMNIMFDTNATSSWVVIGTNTSVGNGIYRQLYTFSSYNTTYWWRAHVTDPSGSGKWTNRTYQFRTKPRLVNHTPTITNPNPANNSVEIPLSTSQLTFLLSDREGDLMNYTVQTSPNIGGTSDHDVGNGTKTVSISGLAHSTTYYWYVNATDSHGSKNWTNQTFKFTTGFPPRGWVYYRKIVIDHTQVDANLTNFPILINVSSDVVLASHAQHDGDDIRFFDQTNITQLNHEIEYYNSNTGRLVCWVNVTFLSSTQDTIIWMNYGNTTCGSQQHVTGVWNSQFRLVHHLNELISTQHDSTSYHNDGTVHNGVLQNVIGKIDGADYFDGSNDYVETAYSYSLDVPNMFTLEGWINSDVPQSGSLTMQPFNKPYCYIYSYFHTAPTFSGTATFSINNGGTWFSSGGPVSVSSGAWHYISAVYDGSYLRTYVDGIQQSSNNVGSQTLTTNTRGFLIGCGWGTDYASYFHGKVDEVRISALARNSSWVKTSYNTMNTPGTFLSIGGEARNQVTLTITKSGTGSGAVEVNRSGPYYYGDEVKLWANASTGSTFTVWSGALSATMTPQILTLNSSKAVNAEFTLNGPYSLTITKSGTGSGTVEKNNTGLYYYGAKVKLWANASVGSTFSEWTGALSGTDTPQILTIFDNTAVDAEFTLNGPYSLTITKSGTGSGTVEKNNTGPYYYGSKVKLWANASTESTFTGWTGALGGTDTPQTLTITENTGVDAEFTFSDSVPPTITNVKDTPDPQAVNGYINISCDVTDNVGVGTVKVYIIGPVGFSPENTTITGENYYYNTSYSLHGTYTYFIWAEDINGNSDSSLRYTFSIVDLSQYRIVSVSSAWNLVSLSTYHSINKIDIFIRYQSKTYNWNEAVRNRILLAWAYNWSRSGQTYTIADTLAPGYGYWMWAFYDCELLFNSSGTSNPDITTMEPLWNILGSPHNTSIWKNDLIVRYNLHDYSWYEATTNNNEEGHPLILGFIYGWNQYTQTYGLSNTLTPGHSYWMYAYYGCILKKGAG